MKEKVIPILIVLGLSMFCGFVVIAGGLGTLTSPLNVLAAPLVCGDRSLDIERDDSAYIPGEGTTRVTAYCFNPQNGEKQDVSADLMGVITGLQILSGFIAGLVVFVIAMWVLTLAARRLNIPFEKLFQPSSGNR